jgi:hypothetical protein
LAPAAAAAAAAARMCKYVCPIKTIENVVLFHSTKNKTKNKIKKEREGQDKMTPKGHNNNNNNKLRLLLLLARCCQCLSKRFVCTGQLFDITQLRLRSDQVPELSAKEN